MIEIRKTDKRHTGHEYFGYVLEIKSSPESLIGSFDIQSLVKYVNGRGTLMGLVPKENTG